MLLLASKSSFLFLFCLSSYFVCLCIAFGVFIRFRMIHCKLICLSTIYLYPRILTSKDIGIRPFPDFIRYLACQRLNCSNSTEIPKNGKFLFRRLARKSNVATRIIQRGRRFYVDACKRIFNADKRVFVKPCAV